MRAPGDVVDQALVENLERGDSKVKMIGVLMLYVDPKSVGGIAQIRVQYKSRTVFQNAVPIQHSLSAFEGPFRVKIPSPPIAHFEK